MSENIVHQIIQKANKKRVSFEILNQPEQQAVNEAAEQIQQQYGIEFLPEDVIVCINRSKGNICCYETLICERAKMFRKYGGREGWLIFKSLMNDTDDE